MAVSNHVSRRLGVVKVDDVIEQRRMGLFPKKLALAIVETGRQCSCNQELADSGELGNERASQHIRTTLIEAPESQASTDQELLKLSQLAKVTKRLVS